MKLSKSLSVQDRQDEHKARMKKKKLERTQVKTGFTPSPQPRVDGRIALATKLFMEQGMTQEDAYRNAIRQTLPASFKQFPQGSIITLHRAMQRNELRRLKREEERLREGE